MAESIEELLFRLKVDPSQLDTLAPAVTEELVKAARAASAFSVDESAFLRMGEQMGASVLAGLQRYLSGKGIDVASLFTGDLSKAVDKSGVQRLQQELSQAASRANGRVASDPGLAQQSAQLQELITRRERLAAASIPRAPLETVGGQPILRKGVDLARLLGLDPNSLVTRNASGNLNQAGARSTLSGARDAELGRLEREISNLSSTLRSSYEGSRSSGGGDVTRGLAANLDRLAPAFEGAGRAKDKFIENLQKLERVFEAVATAANAAAEASAKAPKKAAAATAAADAAASTPPAPASRSGTKKAAQESADDKIARAALGLPKEEYAQARAQVSAGGKVRSIISDNAVDDVIGSITDIEGSGKRIEAAYATGAQTAAGQRARVEALMKQFGDDQESIVEGLTRPGRTLEQVQKLRVEQARLSAFEDYDATGINTARRPIPFEGATRVAYQTPEEEKAYQRQLNNLLAPEPKPAPTKAPVDSLTEARRAGAEVGRTSLGDTSEEVVGGTAKFRGQREAIAQKVRSSLADLQAEVEVEGEIAREENRRRVLRQRLARTAAAGGQLSPEANSFVDSDPLARRNAQTYNERQQRLQARQNQQEALRDYINDPTVSGTKKTAAVFTQQVPGQPAVQGESVGNRFRNGFLGDRLDPVEQIGQTLRFSTFYGGAYTVLAGLEQAFSQATQGALQYEAALKVLEVSTNGTREENEGLAASLSKVGTATGFGAAVGVQVGATNVGLYDLSQVDADTRNRKADNATAVSLRLARIGNTDPQQVATQLAGTIRAFGLSDDSQAQVEDIASVISKRSGVSSADLLQATAQIGTAAQGAGYDLPQTLAAISQIRSSTGETPTAVAGYLSQIFSRSSDPNSQARLAAVGVDTNGTTLAEQFEQLKGLGLPDDQLNQITQSFSKGRAGQALTILLRQDGQVDQLANDARNAPAGLGQQVFGQLYNTDIAEQFKKLGGDFGALVGELVRTGLVNFLFALVEAARAVVNLMTGVVSAFNLLPTPLRQTITMLGELYLGLRLLAALKGVGAVATVAGNLGTRIAAPFAAARTALLTQTAATAPVVAATRASGIITPASAEAAAIASRFGAAPATLSAKQAAQAAAAASAAGSFGAGPTAASAAAIAQAAAARKAAAEAAEKASAKGLQASLTRFGEREFTNPTLAASPTVAAAQRAALRAGTSSAVAGGVIASNGIANGVKAFAGSTVTRVLVPLGVIAGASNAYSDTQSLARAASEAGSLSAGARDVDELRAAASAQKAVVAQSLNDQNFGKFSSLLTLGLEPAYNKLPGSAASITQKNARDQAASLSAQADALQAAQEAAQKANPAATFDDFTSADAVSDAMKTLSTRGLNAKQSLDALNEAFDTLLVRSRAVSTETAAYIPKGQGGTFVQRLAGGLGTAVDDEQKRLLTQADTLAPGFGTDLNPGFGDTIKGALRSPISLLLHPNDFVKAGEAHRQAQALEGLKDKDTRTKVGAAISNKLADLGLDASNGPVSVSKQQLGQITAAAQDALKDDPDFKKLKPQVRKAVLDGYVTSAREALGDFSASTITAQNVASFVSSAIQGSAAAGARTASLNRNALSGTTEQIADLRTERQKVVDALASAKANGSDADEINSIQTQLDTIDGAINDALETAISQRAAEIDRVTALAQSRRGVDDVVGRQADTLEGLRQKLNDPDLTTDERNSAQAAYDEAQKQQDQNQLAARQAQRSGAVNPRNAQAGLQTQLDNVNDALFYATPGSANEGQLKQQQAAVLSQMTDYNLTLANQVEVLAAGRNEQKQLAAAIDDATSRLDQANADGDPSAIAVAQKALNDALHGATQYALDLAAAIASSVHPRNQQEQLANAVADAKRRLDDATEGGDPKEIANAVTAVQNAENAAGQYALNLAQATDINDEPDNGQVQVGHALDDATRRLADANAGGDPLEIQKATTAYNKAVNDVATYATTLGEAQDANDQPYNQQVQLGKATTQAQANLKTAQDKGDPVGIEKAKRALTDSLQAQVDYSLDYADAVGQNNQPRNQMVQLTEAANGAGRRLAEAQAKGDPLGIARAQKALNDALTAEINYSLDLAQAQAANDQPFNQQVQLQHATEDAVRRLQDAETTGDPLAIERATTAAHQAARAQATYELDRQQAAGSNEDPGNQQVQLGKAVDDARRRYRDAQSTGDPLEIQRTQRALYDAQRSATSYDLQLKSATRAASNPLNERENLLGAISDAKDALADAQATGDPLAIQRALLGKQQAQAALVDYNLTEAASVRAAARDPLDTRQAVLDAIKDATEAYTRVRANPGEFSPKQIADAKTALNSATSAGAQYDLDFDAAQRTLSVAPGDRLGAARVAVENAQASVDAYTARGLTDTIEFLQAQEALKQSIYAFAQTQEEVIAKTARRTGVDLTDPIVQAQVALEDLIAQQNAAPTDAEKAAIQPDIDQAKSTRNISAIDRRVGDLTDANDLKQITDAEYINSLQGEYDAIQAQLAAMDKNATGYEALRQKGIEIAKLLQGASESLNSEFNLNDVTLPTIYEVRRAVGASADQIRSQVVDYSSTQGTVIINGADMTQVIQYINQTLGTGSSSVYSTSPRRAV